MPELNVVGVCTVASVGGGTPPWINPLTIVITVIAVVTIIVKLAMWAEKVNQTRTDFDSQKKTLGEFMAEIRDDIKNILTRLPPVAVAGGSPLQLTDLGRSISDGLKAAEWAVRTAPTMRHRIEGKEPYEIQDICFAYIADEFKPTGEQEAQIKACAYENGIETKQVLDVLAVELRDRLLAMIQADQSTA